MQKTLLPFMLALAAISASAYAQAVDSPVPDTIPNSVIALNTPSIDSSHLNTAFVIPAPDIEALIQKGQNDYRDHKAVSDIVKPYVQAPVDIGEKWRSHLSSVLFYDDNGIGALLAAYNAEKQFQPLPFTSTQLSQGAVFNSADFHIFLHAGLHSLKEATPNDVTATKFVLTDDAGDTIQSLPVSASGVKTVMETIYGASSTSASMNQASTVNGGSSSSTPVNGVITGSGDQISIQSTQPSVSMPATDPLAPDAQTNSWSTTLTTTSIPGPSTHPSYEASYNVSFPLFDSSGQPLVKANAKVLTLHIITPNGELETIYKLHAIKP